MPYKQTNIYQAHTPSFNNQKRKYSLYIEKQVVIEEDLDNNIPQEFLIGQEQDEGDDDSSRALTPVRNSQVNNCTAD